MYQLIKDDPMGVIRLSDGARVPTNDLGNVDCQDFQKWIAQGNAALPVLEITIDEKILEIESSYNIKFQTLQQRLTNVLFSDGLDQEAKTIIIQNEYKELSDQKDLEILEVLGGI